ncbi:MAG: Nucleoside-diphosphate-sugar epimerase [candidate division TM6 bacterium GW2011_GWE2_36_25]|nr:MAG: Nucleoside-diphosphate-sugar epimerase [candidate division TM6 bacterium GW2011_GWF2_36_131]KKQ03504.1 MAG: Nucleoside-diphosphate-sugar epimerase [candidate division TM6 bacterium GW2011_GWE2_36_25]KKQ20222.1 MAG: Nucleoside-diphosphate-sugar epimerase [candidate division TM6 bacterium GW2011_GWA2_36_9]
MNAIDNSLRLIIVFGVYFNVIKGVIMKKILQLSFGILFLSSYFYAQEKIESDFINSKDAKIYLAGHDGLVGAAIMRKLRDDGYTNIVTRELHELNLLNQAATRKFFEEERPDYVFLAAAKVGGIVANNTYPAQFIYENMMIEANIIHAAHEYGVKKLMFLGSSCIYPRLCPQPMKEEYLLTSELEKTNEAYAIAKIAGLKLCEYYKKQYGDNFISCMPTNLYGPGDNFDVKAGHVLPALMMKMHTAKVEGKDHVVLWGTGSVYREFLYVDDVADAIVFLMKHYNGATHINVGTGKDLTIRELAELVKEIVGFEGALVFDVTKPDGTPKKLLDVSKLCALGWRNKVELRQGIKQMYEWFLNHQHELRK